MYQNRLLCEYNYDAFGSSIINYLFADNEEERQALKNNPFRWKSYYCDKETNLFLITSRYYSPELGRFIQRADVSSFIPSNINGTSNLDIEQSNASSFSKGDLNLGFIAEGLNTGSTVHGLYTSISGIINHTGYFMNNLNAYMDDMTMIGTSIKDGVLAFNQFSWRLGKSDAISITLGFGLDIYDSIQRGVSPGGITLGATLTAAKGVGLIYLNKGIMYGATALGTTIFPGIGTVVGFVVGGVVCIVVDIFASNWLDDLIDKIAE